MAYPFGAPPEPSGQGWLFPHRQLKKLISSLLPQPKRFISSTQRRATPRKLQFEPLEPRLLLSADLAFAADPGGSDLTLRLDNLDGVDTVVLLDNEIVDPLAQVVASQALADTSAIRITGGAGDDRLTVDLTNPFIVPVRFDDLGGGDNDWLSLTGALSGHAWNLFGGDDGQVDNVGFTGIEHLVGDSTDDTFTFADGAFVSGSIDAGGGSDTLDYSASTGAVTVNLTDVAAANAESVIGGSVGDTLVGTDTGDNWQIDSADSGSVDGIDFSGFENLQGGSGVDTVVFADGVALTGTLDTGAGSDTLDYSANSSPVTINVADVTAASAESVIGSGGVDTLVGTDDGDTWQISGLASGSVAGVSFSSFENLQGGSGDDIFAFTSGGSVSSIAGGGGIDTLDYSALSSNITVDLVGGTADLAGSISGIENILLGSGSDMLLGALLAYNADTGLGNDRLDFGNVAGDLSITIGADGKLTASDGTDTVTGITGVEDLVGSAGKTNVVFEDGASIPGTITGNQVILDYSLYTTDVQVDLATGDANGTSVIGNIVDVRGGVGENTLFGPSGDLIWDITGAGAGSVLGVAFLRFEHLRGSSGKDTFRFLGGSLDSVDGGAGDDTFQFLGGDPGSVSGGAGNDTLDYSAQTDALTYDLEGNDGFENIIAGSGNDTLVGYIADMTWNITGADSGDAGGVAFSGFENLTGRADNEDSFVVTQAGSLSGAMDGGAGGFDVLVLDGGTFNNVKYVAWDAHSGTVTRDGEVLIYYGLEPITDNMNVADRVIDLSANEDTATLTQSGLMYSIASTDPTGTITFETVNFTKPTTSLTINMGADNDIPFLSRDKLTISGAVDLSDVNVTIEGEDGKDEVVISGTFSTGDLVVNAEKIEVSGTVTTNADVDSSGNVVLNADAEDDGAVDDDGDLLGGVFQGLYVATPEARIDVTGGINAAGDLTMTADAKVDATTIDRSEFGGVIAANLVAVMPTAVISLDGASISAANVSGASAIDVDVAFVDAATGGEASNTDAAISIVNVGDLFGLGVGEGASTTVTSGSSITTGGSVSLSALTNLNVTATADGSGGSAGATVAVTEVNSDTSVELGGTSTIANTATSITLTATLESTISTTATSTAGGSTESGGGTASSNESERRLADPNQDGATDGMGNSPDQAATSEGSLSFAGAVVFSDYRPSTSSIISTSGMIGTTGALSLMAMSTDSVSAKADGTNTGSGSTGIGLGVSIGLVDPTVSASLTGGNITAAGGVTLAAAMDADNTYKVEAVSGIGDSTQLTFAGALAIHVVTTTVEALVGGTVNLNDSDLTVSATSDSKVITSATPKEDSGTGAKTGIGASVAFAVVDNQTHARIVDGAALTGIDALTMTATTNQAVETTAQGGAAGGTAVTPVAAITLLYSDTAVALGSMSNLSAAGNVTMTATHNASSQTTAEGDAEGTSAAVGISFGLSIDEQTSMVQLLSDLTSTAGAVALKSSGVIRTRTDALASAAGADQDDNSGTQDVNDTSQQQTDFANNQAANRGSQTSGTTTPPSADNEDGMGGGGSVSVAAAFGITVQTNTIGLDLADTITVDAATDASLRALGNVDS
ncbi:MAG: LEPR-XLL domain-containing protein, partial [Gammaproteobacteria bacterium]|nr:LEPR-XLL domain-containing protein [Gammaproteobacteria bacterium]